MNNLSWNEIVNAVYDYSDTLAEFKTIMDELEYGDNTVLDYPGLVQIILNNRAV